MTAVPPVVGPDDFATALAQQVQREKELTHLADEVSAHRRRLPMTPVANHTFDGPDGPLTMVDLFQGCDRLVVQHVMFGPDQDQGCPFCSYAVDSSPRDLSHLRAHGIAHALVSHAPVEKLRAYQARMGWGDLLWVSAAHCSFNQDWGWSDDDGEVPGFSCYLLHQGRPHLTYLTRQRGVEPLLSTVNLVDRTVYGRCEAWEDSPPGWPQGREHEATLRRHDEYPWQSSHRGAWPGDGEGQ